IVRFIVISIGIDRFIKKRLEKLDENDKESAIPKVIDYACGVAHFLTECIDEINKIIEKNGIKVRTPWEEKFIFGIEKDYRLARTAKIACFLNGDGSANIVHGDGLDDHEILKVDEKKFDILLTNPPYSIANFKRYLDVRPQYELLEHLTENSSEIEVLFIERAKQIVEEKGRVAIVLPASILTNSNVYKKARELILKYFEIKAIAEFGSKTFIATGTNTVVMFLERRGDWFVEDRIRIADEIFTEKKIKTNDYVDIEKLFNSFIDYRKLPKDEYKSFVLENVLTDGLRNHKTFKQYQEAFKSSPDFRNIEKDRNLSDEEKQEKAEEAFKDWIRKIEKEKFLYFSLMFMYGDKYEDENWYKLQKIVIARSPSDTESQKKYLGYEFSRRRGYEGIQILKDENNKPISKLYDDDDYDNKTKVAYYIRESFENNLENIEVDSEVEEFVKIYNLPDLFDFERGDFGKEINLDVSEKSVNYKFPMMRLGDSSLTLLIDSGQNAPQESRYFADGSIPFVRAKDLNYVSTNGYIQINNCDRINQIAVDDLKLKIYEENSIVFPKSGQSINTDNIGILPEKSAVVNHLAIIRTNEEKLHFKYLYYLLKYIIKPSSLKSGKGDYPSINIDTIKNIHIPLPPIEIQKQIVQEIEKLEYKYLFNQQKIKKLMNKMWDIIDEVIKDSTLQRIKLERVLLKKNCPVKVPRNKWLIQGDIPVVSQESEKLISGYVMKDNYEPYTELPVLIFGDHTCSIKYVDFPFVCGADGVVVLKLDSNIIIPKFAYFLLKKLILNLPNIGKYERHFKYLRYIEIPLPPIEIQKQIVQEIEELEKEIDRLNKENEVLEKEKIAVLTKHLISASKPEITGK
ncbi:MAG: N-6 DNA methylase, partial [Candidatus Aenigmatarchaeota archaeon]